MKQATFNHHFDHEISNSGDVVSSKLPKSAVDRLTYIESLKNTSIVPKELLRAIGPQTVLPCCPSRLACRPQA